MDSVFKCLLVALLPHTKLKSDATNGLSSKAHSCFACRWMNAVASEVEVEKARNKNAHAVTTHSSHKGRDTIKCFAAGCGGPIGEMFDGLLARGGNGGSLLDCLATELMNLVDCVPCGHAVNVDKGFLTDNVCAEIGIGCTCSPNKLKKQVQQSAEDAAHAQKVGNARTVVEQVNGGAKMSCRHFNGTTPLLQVGLAPKILRVCCLLQNFQPALIPHSWPSLFKKATT
jgi:hypothetical protein